MMNFEYKEHEYDFYTFHWLINPQNKPKDDRDKLVWQQNADGLITRFNFQLTGKQLTEADVDYIKKLAETYGVKLQNGTDKLDKKYRGFVPRIGPGNFHN